MALYNVENYILYRVYALQVGSPIDCFGLGWNETLHSCLSACVDTHYIIPCEDRKNVPGLWLFIAENYTCIVFMICESFPIYM